MVVINRASMEYSTGNAFVAWSSAEPQLKAAWIVITTNERGELFTVDVNPYAGTSVLESQLSATSSR